MILFVFNHPFPNNTGFSNRVAMELTALAQEHQIMVLCRNSGDEPKRDVFQAGEKKIPIHRFSARLKHMERVDKGYTAGLYEVLRSMDLFIDFCIQLVTISHSVKGVKQLYVTATPLTIPLYAYGVSFFIRASLTVLEFHDLEPEVAKHIKALPDDHWVMKIEYFLERFLSRRFKKVVVTSDSQKKRILERTGIHHDAVHVLPNLVPVVDMSRYLISALKEKYTVGADRFIVSYSGNLSYDYTISGVIEFVKSFPDVLKQVPNALFLIAGDGDGKKHIEAAIQKYSLSEHIKCLGRVSDVREVLAITDVAIIPWIQDEMTETILPTKLFEYMAAGKAVIVPDFGEFTHIINQRKNGITYSTIAGAVSSVVEYAEDHILRKNCGEEAYKTYREQYDPEKQLSSYRAFIQKQL